MQTVKEIVAALGEDAICQKVGVGEHSIRAAKHAGSFPANWYAGLRELCEQRAVECPLEVFNWKSPSQQPHSEGS